MCISVAVIMCICVLMVMCISVAVVMCTCGFMCLCVYGNVQKCWSAFQSSLTVIFADVFAMGSRSVRMGKMQYLVWVPAFVTVPPGM